PRGATTGPSARCCVRVPPRPRLLKPPVPSPSNHAHAPVFTTSSPPAYPDGHARKPHVVSTCLADLLVKQRPPAPRPRGRGRPAAELALRRPRPGPEEPGRGGGAAAIARGSRARRDRRSRSERSTAA